MIELTNLMALMWMVGTGILWTGISFATVKVTLKISQRNFEKRLDEMSKGWTCMERRLTEDEKNYMTRTACEHEQSECGKHRDYHENQFIQKLDGLKEFMVAMDSERKNTRKELSEKLSSISAELAVLKRDVSAWWESRDSHKARG